ncbi:PP2C family protein-serine/threonine phosphatase [Candidatus Peregrinibacteria bacterium]|nr:PP2C family protein-serine/threonine phosphatase [Candidatus Peregrinibacteria bacterium]
MRFIRKSIIGKAIFFFALLLGGIVGGGIYLRRNGIEEVPSDWIMYGAVAVLLLIFFVFVWDVFMPLARVTRQVTNLLTGKTFRRITPSTIDEVGVFTHFFNEITLDLEKISYDVKERRRMSSELDIASSIQRDVLPKEAPEAPGLDIVAKTRSAAEVGGDTFDFLTTADGSQVFIYIGDVTGHGVPSGLIMMMVDTIVTSMVYQGVSNGQELIAHTNYLLHPRISSRLFMTSVALRWDKSNQQMYFTGAGHEHVLVYRKRREEVDAIPSGGIALGMIPDVSKIVQEKPIPLEIGDCIVLYTDGITEAKNQIGEMYGLGRLQKALKRNGYKPSAEAVFDGITKDFSDFVEEYVQMDDITMIVIKYMGKDFASQKVKLTVSKENAEEIITKSKKWDWA